MIIDNSFIDIYSINMQLFWPFTPFLDTPLNHVNYIWFYYDIASLVGFFKKYDG